MPCVILLDVSWVRTMHEYTGHERPCASRRHTCGPLAASSMHAIAQHSWRAVPSADPFTPFTAPLVQPDRIFQRADSLHAMRRMHRLWLGPRTGSPPAAAARPAARAGCRRAGWPASRRAPPRRPPAAARPPRSRPPRPGLQWRGRPPPPRGAPSAGGARMGTPCALARPLDGQGRGPWPGCRPGLRSCCCRWRCRPLQACAHAPPHACPRRLGQAICLARLGPAALSTIGAVPRVPFCG